MAKYDDLTPDQRHWLTRIAAAIRPYPNEGFAVHFLLDHAALSFRHANAGLLDLPREPLLLQAYHDGGYIHLEWDSPSRVCFIPAPHLERAVAFWAKSRWSRWWINLLFDLGHNETFRSRLLWHGFSIAVAVFLAYLREIALWLGQVL